MIVMATVAFAKNTSCDQSRHLVDSVRTGLIQRHGIERSEHADVRDDWRVIFRMAIAERRNVHHDADMEMRTAFQNGPCVSICPKDAISASYNSEPGSLDKKMAEYAWAVLEGRPHFHICIVMDVSPFCDCHPENDAPIVSDVGMFASFDPVALDQACADAVNKMPALVAGSILGERDRCHHDHFKDVSPTTNWEIQLEHSEKLGIGTRQYELITVK